MDLLAKLHLTRRSIAKSGYVFNDRMIRREKTIAAIHLEVAERVYFCFDLMLMLRAMMDECPPLALDGSVAIGEGGK